jgi:hypothetical protein
MDGANVDGNRIIIGRAREKAGNRYQCGYGVICVGVPGMNKFTSGAFACHASDANRSPRGYGACPHNIEYGRPAKRERSPSTAYYNVSYGFDRRLVGCLDCVWQLSLGVPCSGATCFDLIAAFVFPWCAGCPRVATLMVGAVPGPSTSRLWIAGCFAEAVSGAQRSLTMNLVVTAHTRPLISVPTAVVSVRRCHAIKRPVAVALKLSCQMGVRREITRRAGEAPFSAQASLLPSDASLTLRPHTPE